MLKLFRKNSQKKILQKKFEKLMKDAHHLSSINRKLSDTKIFEAEEVMKQIEKLV